LGNVLPGRGEVAGQRLDLPEDAGDRCGGKSLGDLATGAEVWGCSIGKENIA